MKIYLILILIFSFVSLFAGWTKIFGGRNYDEGWSVQQTTDGGYIVAGVTSSYGTCGADVYLIKTNSNGNALWSRTFGGRGDQRGYSVQQTSDGGYIVVGGTSPPMSGLADVYLIKTDAEGNALWTRTFGGSDDESGSSVQQTNDGGYIIAGWTGLAGYGAGYDIYLIKTDSAGDTLWTRTFEGSDDSRGWSVQQTTDGGFIVAGCGMYNYLIKTDNTGNTLWTETFMRGTVFSVRQTTDGGFIVAGSVFDNDGDVYLIKTDSTGDSLWTRTFGGSSYDKGWSVQQTTDGGYIVVGFTQSYGAGAIDVYLIKTNSNGDTLWTRTFGGSDDDRGISVQQTTDGGYIVAGITRSCGIGEYVFLIKTDADGNIKEE